MKLSTLLSLLLLGLEAFKATHATKLVRVNVDRPSDDELEPLSPERRVLTATEIDDMKAVAEREGRELQFFGWRWRFYWRLPYIIWLYPGRYIRFRFCFWYWGLYFYNFWWWRWWWPWWPWWGYPYYPWYWWWWRKVYYIPYYLGRNLGETGGDRGLQLNVHGYTEGPGGGNDVVVDSDQGFNGAAQFHGSGPGSNSFITHGLDLKLGLPKNADGPVQIEEISGAVDAEIIEFRDQHPEMYGDPHIMTWTGQHFEYQGECDLVFLRDKDFMKGKGLEIDVRTKHRYDYSFIESVGIQIGEDVLEVDSFGDHALNGVEAADLEETTMDLAGFPIHHRQPEEKKHIYDIVLTERSNITVTSFKDIVAVSLSGEDMFSDNTVGILGSIEGDMLGRDGVTLISDPNEFGQEWQVRNDEKMLFRTAREPQYPSKCVLPDGRTSEERRLGGDRGANKMLGAVTEEQAEAVCSHFKDQGKADCIEDVIGFNDLDIARAGGY